MNASRMRREGRRDFCPEVTAEEYLATTGRNLYGYALQCFKQGWDEEALRYKDEQKQLEHEAKEAYLGDGVYASTDGYNIILDLRAQDNTTKIYLEPSVLRALNEFDQQLQNELRESKDGD